jgi:hypothetical protein
MAEQKRQFTKGDTQVSVFAELFTADGKPLDMTTISGATAKFRMVDGASHAVKVNGSAAVIVSSGGTVSGVATPAVVRYDWSPGDVDTVSSYWAWFIITDGNGKTQHFPTGRGFQLNIVDEA